MSDQRVQTEGLDEEAEAFVTAVAIARIGMGDIPSGLTFEEAIQRYYEPFRGGREALLFEASMDLLVRILKNLDADQGPTTGWSAVMTVFHAALEGDTLAGEGDKP